jgi:hypothetical protein
VVFMMMILTITTTSFFPLSELFDRECARAVMSFVCAETAALTKKRREKKAEQKNLPKP